MEIIRKQIEGKNVVLSVDETLSNKVLGGQPILKIEDKLTVIYAVDTLKVIKGIANANILDDLVESVEGSWAEDGIKEIVDSFVEEDVKCDRCEHLLDYPISVIDEEKKLLFGQYDYHFVDGYKCTYNGAEGLTKEELIKEGCNKI